MAFHRCLNATVCLVLKTISLFIVLKTRQTVAFKIQTPIGMPFYYTICTLRQKRLDLWQITLNYRVIIWSLYTLTYTQYIKLGQNKLK